MSSSSTFLQASLTDTPAISTAVRITIPSETLTTKLLETEPFLVTPNPTNAAVSATDQLTSTPPSMNRCGSVEKVGRWSEEEHVVFVEGLTTYGRQWKTIAGMIGTRSVVQVRTHAQKYFQKLDRKNQNIQVPNLKSNTAPAAPTAVSKPQKRKSLPSSLPSRKNKSRKASSRQMSLSLASRLSSASDLTQIDLSRVESPPPLDLSSYPNYISKSSGSLSDGENWSTVSPYGVMDLVDLDKAALAAVDDDTINGQSNQTHAAFDMMGDDPLEWLIETDTDQYLPESSLPLFPDLNEDYVVTTESPSPAPQEAAAKPDHEPTNMVESAVLNNMVDPNVTVQTLLL